MPRYVASSGRGVYSSIDVWVRIEENEIAADAIGERFRRGAVDGRIQAHVVTVEK
jgi:hypothetical protein